ALLVPVLCVSPAFAQTCIDSDGDGYSPDGGLCGPVDCDDTNPNLHPGAPEICNGLDDNCDGNVDEDPDASNSCATQCTATAQCVAGSCVTTPLNCDDNNACTVDWCSLTQGCRHANQPDGLSCTDGNPCNGEETCGGGHCTSGTPLDCGDGNVCTT